MEGVKIASCDADAPDFSDRCSITFLFLARSLWNFLRWFLGQKMFPQTANFSLRIAPSPLVFELFAIEKKNSARNIRKQQTTFLFYVFRHSEKLVFVLIDFLVPKSLRNRDLGEKQKSEDKKTDFWRLSPSDEAQTRFPGSQSSELSISVKKWWNLL